MFLDVSIYMQQMTSADDIFRFTKGITVFKIFISGGISSDIQS